VIVEATPTALCVGDEFRTDIRLDGRKSAAALSLVYAPPDPSAPPLMFRWSFSGAEVRVEDGDPSDDHLVVRTKGDRPLHVRLHVKNAKGGEADALTTIAITPLDGSGACPLTTQ
jgi:hypothetical protein